MGQEIDDQAFSAAAFAEFRRRLVEETELLTHQLATGKFSDVGGIGGYELEAWLVDHNYFPTPNNQAVLERLANPLVVPELSRFNVELNGEPHPLGDQVLSKLCDELGNTWQLCQQAAHDLDSTLMMIGILPTIRQQDLCLANMSASKRYRALNEQVLARRAGHPLHINIQGREHLDILHPDVMLEAATTSFQIHLQCAQDEAARYFNASLIAAAPLLAASGNSPFLFGHDLWDETRIPLFEQSVDSSDMQDTTRQRVCFGHGYAKHSLAECFADNLATYRPLLPALMDCEPERYAHLRLHNGTIWRWVRPLVGFDADGKPHLRVEQRVLPAGPTVIDMIANAALYFGLAVYLAELKDAPEDHLSFAQASDNFYQAARLGLDAELVWLDGSQASARTLLLEEILPRARYGLEALGFKAEQGSAWLDIIEARVRNGQTGAVWQRRYRHKLAGGETQRWNKLELTAAYLERQRSGAPVHEWSV